MFILQQDLNEIQNNILNNKIQHVKLHLTLTFTRLIHYN